MSMWFQARLCNSSSWNNTLANHWHVNNPVILDLGRQSFYPRNPIVDTYAFTVWSPQGIEPTKKILRLSNIHQSSRAIVSVWPGIKLQFFVIFSNCSQRHLLTGIFKKNKQFLCSIYLGKYYWSNVEEKRGLSPCFNKSAR